MTDLDVAPHQSANPARTRYTLIDVDAHITESPDTWTSRVAERFRDRVPHVRRVDGQDVWFIDGQVASPVGPTAPAGWREPAPAMPQTYDDLLPAAYDAKARLAHLDEVGIWAQLLYPNVGGFGGQRFLAAAGPGVDVRVRPRLQRLAVRMDLRRPATADSRGFHAVLGCERLRARGRAVRCPGIQGDCCSPVSRIDSTCRISEIRTGTSSGPLRRRIRCR